VWEFIQWLASRELPTSAALIFLYSVRLFWTVYALYAAKKAYSEYRKNRKAYVLGKSLRNGKKIVRKGRHQRSRRVLIAFSIAAFIGLLSTVQALYVPPPIQASVISIFLTLLIIIMLVQFQRAVEADIHMREEARNFAELSSDDTQDIQRRIGEETMRGPEDAVEDAKRNQGGHRLEE
jgi:choline-glycine betaine transporter